MDPERARPLAPDPDVEVRLLLVEAVEDDVGPLPVLVRLDEPFLEGELPARLAGTEDQHLERAGRDRGPSFSPSTRTGRRYSAGARRAVPAGRWATRASVPWRRARTGRRRARRGRRCGRRRSRSPGSSWNASPKNRSPCTCSRVAVAQVWGTSRVGDGLQAARVTGDHRAALSHSGAANQAASAADDDERLIDHRQSLGEIGVLRQVAVAVSDREDGRDELDAGLRRRRLDLLDVLEVIGRDAVEHLELVVGDQHRRVAVLLGPVDQRDHVLDRLVDLQVGAAIDPALGIASRAVVTGPGCGAERQEKRAAPAIRARLSGDCRWIMADFRFVARVDEIRSGEAGAVKLGLETRVCPSGFSGASRVSSPRNCATLRLVAVFHDLDDPVVRVVPIVPQRARSGSLARTGCIRRWNPQSEMAPRCAGGMAPRCAWWQFFATSTIRLDRL